MKRKNDRTGSGGIAIVDAIVNLDMRWIFRSQDKPGTDYGVDAHIEITDHEGVETGRQFAAQVKAGQWYLREATSDGFVNRPSDRHVRYWRNYALPVVLILVDDQARVAYWALTDRIEATPTGGWKLVVPRSQMLGPDAKGLLSQVALGGGTERARARADERQQTEDLRQRVKNLEEVITTYVAQLAARSAVASAPAPTPRIDVLSLTFSELVAWSDTADFEAEGTAPTNRSAYVLAAEKLFFQESIAEHDAAKAISLLLLANEWSKAATLFLYSIELARDTANVATPSIVDFLASSRLPPGIPLDLRIILRTMQIAARRKCGRDVHELLSELDAAVKQATPSEGAAVTVAAFWEARATGRSAPGRAIRYLRVAALLRPQATGFGGGPFPPSLDEAWRLILELTAPGLSSDRELADWLEGLDAVPSEARATVVGDEMSAVTLANQFWLTESTRPKEKRTWRAIHDVLELLEAWSTKRCAALLFAAARRSRIIVSGEYEDDLGAALRLSIDVPSFVRKSPHAMFLLNEIAASQFLYNERYLEAVSAFRGALIIRPTESPILASTLLKAAQAAAAANLMDDAVRFAHEGVETTRNQPYAGSTDVAVAQAELALAHWYAGDREASLNLWDETAENILNVEKNTPRWRGLLVRFRWAGGYLINTYSTGVSPTSDAEGRPYGEPRPGAFLIDLSTQADLFDDEALLAVMLGLASISDKRKRDERTRRWIYAALEYAAARAPGWRRMLGLLALPHLIADGRYIEAVELGSAMGTGPAGQDLSHGADGRLITMSLSVVPVFLALSRRAKPQSAPARALIDGITQHLDMQAISIACQEIVEITFISGADASERLAALEAIRRSEGADFEESPIELLCDIGESIIPGTSHARTLELHQRIASELERRLSAFPTMHRLHVVPFFRDHWLRRIEEDPLAFDDAEKTTSSLLAISDELHAPKAILLAVARHLRLW